MGLGTAAIVMVVSSSRPVGQRDLQALFTHDECRNQPWLWERVRVTAVDAISKTAQTTRRRMMQCKFLSDAQPFSKCCHYLDR